MAFAPKSNSVAQFSVYDNVSPLTGLDARQWIPLDVTGDGRDDFVYLASQSVTSYVYALVRLPVGGYRSERTPIPAWPALRSWKPMDVNGDGRVDLVHLGCTYSGAMGPCTLVIDTFFATGDGRFTRAPTAQHSWAESRGDIASWRPVDANGDGKVDLVHLGFAPAGAPTLQVKTLLANGNGTWVEQPLRSISSIPTLTVDPLAARRLQGTQNWRSMDVDGNGRAESRPPRLRRRSPGNHDVGCQRQWRLAARVVVRRYPRRRRLVCPEHGARFHQLACRRHQRRCQGRSGTPLPDLLWPAHALRRIHGQRRRVADDMERRLGADDNRSPPALGHARLDGHRYRRRQPSGYS